DLLDLSRITRGIIDLHREPVDLVAAVQAAVDAAKPLVTANEHTLTVELPEVQPQVYADSVRLTQIITNLLNNAAKYTPRQGVIVVRCQAISNSDGSKQLEIRVSDNGAGIPPNMLNRVFDLFTQLDNTRNLAHGGLGIGLTLVRSLVDLHGGTVEAHSEGIGRGSEFIVRLPLRATRMTGARE